MHCFICKFAACDWPAEYAGGNIQFVFVNDRNHSDRCGCRNEIDWLGRRTIIDVARGLDVHRVCKVGELNY